MDNLTQSRATRPNNDQKLHMLQFLEDNLDLANDKYESSFDGANKRNEKWDYLAKELNGLNGANKTGDKWRKYWQDQRSYVKERNAIINGARIKTGVHTKIKELSDYEKRVTDLITAQAIVGDIAVAEFGDNELIEVELPIVSEEPSELPTAQPSMSRSIKFADQSSVNVNDQPQKNADTPRATQTTKCLTSRKRRQISTDDDDQFKKYLEFEMKKFEFEKEYKLQKLSLMKKQIEVEESKVEAIANLCESIKGNQFNQPN